jgi:pyruvate kinase
MPVMAKIERPEAIDDLDAILAEADGLLVARGDLGVELAAERVPILQKQIVEAANAAGKPVMTATQMLESMRDARRPTRAEASDVANAVLDGSDSLLLTAETAVGRYPVEAVETMARIVEQAESAGRTRAATPPRGELPVSLSACRAACRAAFDVGARCLAVFTSSGFSARQTARFRPAPPILAFTPSAATARRLALVWGVEPTVIRPRRTVESLIRALDRELADREVARPGDVAVVVAGEPIGVSGSTNLIKLHRVGGRRRAARRKR